MPGARRYHIHEAVGRGAFGIVYRATMVGEGGFKKEVAVKLLNDAASSNESIVSRLRDEARVLGHIRHRAILQVDGLVHVMGSRWALVTEYIRGSSLHEVNRAGTVPVGVVAEIIGEVAGALHAAYATTTTSATGEAQSLKLVHRDIKPANIQVTTAAEVKILDFGIARADFADRESETQALVLGTPGYMSPERFDGRTGPEGDIYALGVVAVELVTGNRMGKTSVSPGRHVEHVTRALQEADKIPEFASLRELVMQMLDYEPDARPTARDVERRCRQIRTQLPPPFLAEWAETTIGALVAARPPVSDDNTIAGATLSEGTDDSMIKQESTKGPSPLDTSNQPEGTEVEATVMEPPRPQGFVPSGKLIAVLGAVAVACFAGAVGLGLIAAWQMGALDGSLASASAAPAAEPPADKPPEPIVDKPAEKPPEPVADPGEKPPEPVTSAEAPAEKPPEPVAVVDKPPDKPVEKPPDKPAAPAEKVVPAAITSGPVITQSEFAAWLATHADWQLEAAVADGRAGDSYLLKWTGTTPPKPGAPATSITWGAAAAFCADRGGLPSITAAPKTWDQNEGRLKEWRSSGGKPAWHRFDGETNTSVKKSDANVFTAFRCAK